MRLGGIYALARIAHDSAKDYPLVMNILTAYVRHNAPWPNPSPARGVPATGTDQPKLRSDIQAILTTLGRPTSVARKLDLRRTDLRAAQFWDAHLRRPTPGARTWEAHSSGGAQLDRAKLENANLDGANLRASTLALAVLTNASLTGADLREADLSKAIGLTQAQIDSFRKEF